MRERRREILAAIQSREDRWMKAFFESNDEKENTAEVFRQIMEPIITLRRKQGNTRPYIVIDLGCGDGALSEKIARVLCNDFCLEVHFRAIDKSSDLAENAQARLRNITRLKEVYVVTGNCFSELSLDEIFRDDIPSLILASHSGYYAGNYLEGFLNSLVRRSGKDTIILMIHGSSMSEHSRVLTRYSSKVHTSVTKTIDSFVEKRHGELHMRELLFNSFIFFGDKEDIIWRQHLLEFLIHQPLDEMVLRDRKRYLSELEELLTRQFQNMIIWASVQIIIPGCNVYRKCLDSAVRQFAEYRNAQGFCPLHWAAFEGRREVVEDLVRRLSDNDPNAAIGVVDVVNSRIGVLTPLYMATLGRIKNTNELYWNCYRQTIEFLLGYGANLQSIMLSKQMNTLHNDTEIRERLCMQERFYMDKDYRLENSFRWLPSFVVEGTCIQDPLRQQTILIEDPEIFRWVCENIPALLDIRNYYLQKLIQSTAQGSLLEILDCIRRYDPRLLVGKFIGQNIAHWVVCGDAEEQESIRCLEWCKKHFRDLMQEKTQWKTTIAHLATAKVRCLDWIWEHYSNLFREVEVGGFNAISYGVYSCVSFSGETKKQRLFEWIRRQNCQELNSLFPSDFAQELFPRMYKDTLRRTRLAFLAAALVRLRHSQLPEDRRAACLEAMQRGSLEQPAQIIAQETVLQRMVQAGLNFKEREMTSLPKKLCVLRQDSIVNRGLSRERYQLSGYRLERIIGDGDCMYNAVLVAASRNDLSVLGLRNMVANKMEEHSRELAWLNNSYPHIELSVREHGISSINPTEMYINLVRRPGEWGDNLVLNVIAEMLNIRIVVHHEYEGAPTSISPPGSSVIQTIHLQHHLSSQKEELHYSAYVPISGNLYDVCNIKFNGQSVQYEELFRKAKNIGGERLADTMISLCQDRGFAEALVDEFREGRIDNALRRLIGTNDIAETETMEITSNITTACALTQLHSMPPNLPQITTLCHQAAAIGGISLANLVQELGATDHGAGWDKILSDVEQQGIAKVLYTLKGIDVVNQTLAIIIPTGERKLLEVLKDKVTGQILESEMKDDPSVLHLPSIDPLEWNFHSLVKEIGKATIDQAGYFMQKVSNLIHQAVEHIVPKEQTDRQSTLIALLIEMFEYLESQQIPFGYPGKKPDWPDNFGDWEGGDGTQRADGPDGMLGMLGDSNFTNNNDTFTGDDS